MVVLEAAACGVTTVGTAVGILPEIVPPEQVVPVGDVEALAGAITSALSDLARVREIGRGQTDQVRERFTLGGGMMELRTLYAGLVNSAR
jgi:glycosyltransferase involved in cell wall biosynthesis